MSIKNIPLWLSISQKIEEDIETGKYKDIDMLPTEIELCDIYNASRITIRGAMARLVDHGKVRRIKGKGTIINRRKPEDLVNKIFGFTREIQDRGMIPSTSFVSVERRAVSTYVADIFKVPAGTEFIVLERVRCANDMPLAYFLTYLPVTFDFTENPDDYYLSLYDKIHSEMSINLDFLQQTVSAELPDKTTREFLNLLTGEPVLLIKRWAYAQEKLVEYSVCRYDSKRYEYKIDVKENARK